jgi:dTMP kinase
LFITFEGGEGAGKSTQAALLAHALARDGRATLLTREPGGAPGAETLRILLLSGLHDWSPLAEVLLHSAARAEHVAHTISPALAAGMAVVCDRFADSTLAYQGYGQGADRGHIAVLGELLGLKPDLTIVLDLPEDIASQRLAARGVAPDRYDRLGPDFHARVAAGFRAIAADNPRCAVVAAGGSADAVHAAILAVVQHRFP